MVYINVITDCQNVLNIADFSFIQWKADHNLDGANMPKWAINLVLQDLGILSYTHTHECIPNNATFDTSTGLIHGWRSGMKYDKVLTTASQII